MVGRAGEDSLFLSDLDRAQLKSAVARLGADPDGLTRNALEEIVRTAVVAGTFNPIDANPYVWCYSDSARPKRISLWICRDRQKAARTCKGSKCDHSTTIITKKGRKKMADKKKKGETPDATPNPPKGPTKMELLRTAFQEKKEWTVDELVARCGYDERNLRTATAIFRNRSRTKDPINIVWNKEKKTFSLGSMKDVPLQSEA